MDEPRDRMLSGTFKEVMGSQEIRPNKFRCLCNGSIDMTFCSKMYDCIDFISVKNRVDNSLIADIASDKV